MKVAIAQTSLDPSSRSNNQRAALDAISTAAELEPAPDVVCLPARCDCGVVHDPKRTVSAAMSDAFIELLSAKTRDMGLATVVGFCETDGSALFDTAAWIDADGDTLLKHRKVTVNDSESSLIEPGTSITVQNTLFGLVGIAVSEDILTPHVPATMRALGARVIFAPCHFADLNTHVRTIAETAQANQVYIVAVNSVGAAGGGGGSAVFGPAGEITHRLEASSAQTQCAHIPVEE